MIDGKDFFGLWSEFTKDLINHYGIKAHTNLNNDAFPMADLIYHDASHTHDGVYADLIHWFPKLKQNGVMIIDDYESNWPGVITAVDQYVKENNLHSEMVTNRNIMIRRK